MKRRDRPESFGQFLDANGDHARERIAKQESARSEVKGINLSQPKGTVATS